MPDALGSPKGHEPDDEEPIPPLPEELEMNFEAAKGVVAALVNGEEERPELEPVREELAKRGLTVPRPETHAPMHQFPDSENFSTTQRSGNFGMAFNPKLETGMRAAYRSQPAIQRFVRIFQRRTAELERLALEGPREEFDQALFEGYQLTGMLTDKGDEDILKRDGTVDEHYLTGHPPVGDRGFFTNV
jgi:hypothetical protein